jgi:hypothetical protein
MGSPKVKAVVLFGLEKTDRNTQVGLNREAGLEERFDLGLKSGLVAGHGIKGIGRVLNYAPGYSQSDS